MSNSEAFAFSTRAYGSDRFDLVLGTIRHIEKMVREAEIPVEIKMGGEDLGPLGTSESYIFDLEGNLLAELERARKLVEEACQICLQVCVAM